MTDVTREFRLELVRNRARDRKDSMATGGLPEWVEIEFLLNVIKEMESEFEYAVFEQSLVTGQSVICGHWTYKERADVWLERRRKVQEECAAFGKEAKYEYFMKKRLRAGKEMVSDV